ncbi:MAG: GAF domain-containing protein [Armatimonadetes bacterium]|nr:GAF domain-containing protein [Armatimonadota bacterium]
MTEVGILERIVKAEQMLASLKSREVLSLCQGIHSAADVIRKSDAFYVCLYDAETSMLNFVYNVEGEVFDTPESVSLGNGPTSEAIRTGRPFVFRDGIFTLKEWRYYATDETTNSGIHLPIFGISNEIVGVVSVQWYENRGFDEPEERAFEWLACRIGPLLDEVPSESAIKYRVVREVASVNLWWTDHLQVICERLRGERATSNDEVIRQLRALMSSATTGQSVAAAGAETEVSMALQSLTRRQFEVIDLVSEGLRNPKIAEVLGIGENTVKTHISDAFRSLGFQNRSQVGRLTSLIQREKLRRSGDHESPG